LTESQIQTEILAHFSNRRDIVLWRVNSGVAFGHGTAVRMAPKGHADLAGILKVRDIGVALYIEVKTPKGRVSPPQLAFGNMVGAMGGCFILARCVEDAHFGVLKCQQSVENMLK
jgi:hypothetical protein